MTDGLDVTSLADGVPQREPGPSRRVRTAGLVALVALLAASGVACWYWIDTGELFRRPAQDVAHLVAADFGECRPIAAKVAVLRAPPGVAHRDFLKAIGGAKTDLALPTYEKSLGFYESNGRTVIVTGRVTEDAFRQSLVHELCHAYCDLALGVLPGQSAWAHEGYAELITARCEALWGWPNPPSLKDCLRQVARLIADDKVMALEEFMHIRAKRAVTTETLCPGFVSHATMLLYMLARMSKHNPHLLDACKRVIRGDLRRAKKVVQALEECMGLTVSELHERLINFCQCLAANEPEGPAISSPLTFEQPEAAP